MPLRSVTSHPTYCVLYCAVAGWLGACRSGGDTSRGDLYIRFKVEFPRKLGQPMHGDDDEAKAARESLEKVLGQKIGGGGGGGSGFFSGWWSKGDAKGGGEGGADDDRVVVAQRASAAQKRALAAAEQRQTSERERSEGF